MCARKYEETIAMVFQKIKKSLRKYYYLAFMANSYIKIKAGHFRNIQLEIGSGPAKRAGWITLDVCKGVDVYLDLRYKTPFKDASFDRIYCSHVLEHFSYQDLKVVLREIHRILRPNGEFLISVPDASIYVDAYLAGC